MRKTTDLPLYHPSLLPLQILLHHNWLLQGYIRGVATISINESWALPCRALCIIPRRSKMGYHSAFWAGIMIIIAIFFISGCDIISISFNLGWDIIAISFILG